MDRAERGRRVLVMCAHSDDQAIGPGGLIAKLSKSGAQVRTIIASFGENSHPHLQEKAIRTMRVLESKRADRILGGEGVMFLGLREGKFEKGYETRGLHPKLIGHVTRFDPDLIITHASDDPHPDHRAVYRIVMRIHKDANLACEVWMFDIWNLWDFKRRSPRIVIDVSDTFRRKLDAIAAFKSQWHARALLLLPTYIRAIYWGFKRKVRYAERYTRAK